MNTALLIIDVQHGLFDREPRPYDAVDVVHRINELSERARIANVPVVFVQHEAPNSPLEYGGQNWQLSSNLHVKPSDVLVRKTTPDSFLKTELLGLLQQWGTQELVIAGYSTEFCVDTTTRRAAALGYPVRLASDAHTSHDKAHATGALIREHHNFTLSNLRSFGPPIVAIAAADIMFAPQAHVDPAVPARPEGFVRVSEVLRERGHVHAPRWLEVSARTAQEAADALGVCLGQIAKSVVFRRKASDTAVVVITSGDKRVDETKVAGYAGPLSRADAEFVKASTGFSIGGVSPVGFTDSAPMLLIDQELFRFEELWAAAGHPNGVFRLSPQELQALTGAAVVNVVTDTVQS